MTHKLQNNQHLIRHPTQQFESRDLVKINHEITKSRQGPHENHHCFSFRCSRFLSLTTIHTYNYYCSRLDAVYDVLLKANQQKFIFAWLIFACGYTKVVVWRKWFVYATPTFGCVQIILSDVAMINYLMWDVDDGFKVNV